MVHNSILTPTQQQIFEMLSDRLPHSQEEIFKTCIQDQFAQKRVVKWHISRLRKRITPSGKDIESCYYQRKWCYRLVNVAQRTTTRGGYGGTRNER